MARALSPLDELKPSLLIAKTRKVNFGLCLGKQPQGTVLITDKMNVKEPKTLGRLAKQAGETQKATFGTLQLDGQKLLLACQGDAIPGLQRKLREYLKGLGLKLKVVVLDAAGNLLEGEAEGEEAEGEETGGEEAGPGGSGDGSDGGAKDGDAKDGDDDALAQEWARARGKSATLVEACARLPQAGEIAQAWQDCLGTADRGDLRAALLQSEALERRIVEARQAAAMVNADAARWTEAAAKLAPMLQALAGATSPEARKAAALWAYAQGKAAAQPPDYSAAIKSIPPLVKLLQEARSGGAEAEPQPDRFEAPGDDAPGGDGAPVGDQPGGQPGGQPGAQPDGQPGAQPPQGGQPPQPQAGGAQAGPVDDGPQLPPPGKSASDKERLAYAEQQLTALDRQFAAYMALIPGSAEVQPAAWTQARGKVDAALAPMRAPDAALDGRALAAALKALEKLAEAVKAAAAAKAEWKKTLDLLVLRLVPLDRHAKAADAVIAPRIAEVRAEIAKATAAADSQDFKRAQAIAKAQMAHCEEIEKLEDSVAHFDSIHGARKTTVDALAVKGDQELDKIREAAVKLLADADRLKTQEKFAEGVKALDRIPAVVDRHAFVTRMAADYNWMFPELRNWVTTTEGARSAAALQALKPQIDQIRKVVKAGDVAKTKSYETSRNLLQPWIRPVRGQFKADLDAFEAYETDKTAFDVQFEIFRKHKGVSGIQDFFAAMERDREQAGSEAKSGKYGTARVLLVRLTPEWAAQQALADKALVYLDRKKEVDKRLAELRKLPAARAMLDQVDGLLASAFRQFTGKDFDSAKAVLDEAMLRCDDAKAAADAQRELEKGKDSKALGGKNIAKALTAYQDLRAKVAAKDPGGSFATLLAQADTATQPAQAEQAKAKPDLKAAMAAIAAGVRMVEDTLPKVIASGPFQTHLAAARVAAAAMTDPGGKLTARVAEANGHIAEAETAAAAPDFDFTRAERLLVQASAEAKAVAEDAALWPAIKTDLDKITADEAKINAESAPLPTQMQPSLDKLARFRTLIDERIAARDFKGARKAAANGVTATAATDADIAIVKDANTRLDLWYTQKLPAISGPDSGKAQSQIDLANRLKADFDRTMAAGSYKPAFDMLNSLGLAVVGARRLLDEYALYEAKRAPVQVKLATLQGNRNAGVEDAVKALEARYAAGVALSDAETHLPALKAMTALEPDIDALNARALKWKAYDDSRQAALAKIEALERHAQPDATAPMAKALRGAYDGALATAAKGDPDGAKAALDKLPAQADTALAAADAAKAVIDKADGLGDGAVDPALLAEAQKLYDDLAARPDAANAQGELAVAKGQLADAKAAADPAKARELLKTAMLACAMAQTRLAQMETITAALAEVDPQLAALSSHAEKVYIAKNISSINGDLKALREDLRKRGPDAAGNRVGKLNADCAAALLLADQYHAYLTRRAEPEVEPRLAQFEQHPHRYAAKPSIDGFRKKLDQAQKAAEAMEPDKGLKLVEEAATLANSIQVLLKLKQDEVPDPAEIKKILDGPGGSDELDSMVDQLEPEAQRKVLRAAFEARFGTKLEIRGSSDAVTKAEGALVPDGTKAGPDLRRFYDAMSKLPDEHVVDNDSLRLFTAIDGKAEGSSYTGGGKKKILMSEGAEVTSGRYNLGHEHEVGGADKNCQPANDKPVKMFSWNTLHEVGHAVDDKLRFMDRNGNGALYGGWTSHGKDTHGIAQRVAGHFKYDAAYIAQLLASNATPMVPPIPDGETCSEEEWERRRLLVVDWVASARVGKEPWTANSMATRLAIDGVVYHESYGGSWSSYNLVARKQGMTGYQFRASGEWFAELYAAYHSGKMKPTHPAAKWLAGL